MSHQSPLEYAAPRQPQRTTSLAGAGALIVALLFSPLTAVVLAKSGMDADSGVPIAIAMMAVALLVPLIALVYTLAGRRSGWELAVVALAISLLGWGVVTWLVAHFPVLR